MLLLVKRLCLISLTATFFAGAAGIQAQDAGALLDPLVKKRRVRVWNQHMVVSFSERARC
jgi:hypothetical protein